MAVHYKTTSRANQPAGAQVAPKVKRSMLATACAVAVAGAFSGGAMAQSTTYGYTFGVLDGFAPFAPTQTVTPTGYVDAIDNRQGNTANVNALATGNNVSLTATGGVNVPTPGTATNNGILSIAESNKASNFIELGLLTNVGADEGQGIVSGQVTDGARIRAHTDVASTNITENLVGPAPLILSSNTISATTTINAASSVIGLDSSVIGSTGTIPAGGYTGTAIGTALLATTNAGPDTSTLSSGSLAISNNQTAFESSSGAGSRARVTDSDVTLQLSNTVGNNLSSPLTVTDNTLSAAFLVNSGSSIIQSEAGSGAFTGSAVVTNAQANVEAGGNVVTAHVTNSQVLAAIENTTTTTGLSSSLVVSGNTLSATSGGNAAGARSSTGAVLAGNAILLTSGADVTGVGSSSSVLLDNNSAVLGQNALLEGDLALVSAQQNRSTELESLVTNGGTTNTSVGVLADFVSATGSVVANQNTVSTRTTGNLAGNLVGVNAANFNAGVAVGNVQLNEDTPITARTINGGVRADIGTDALAAAAIQSGSVALSQNAISAIAEGSVASTAAQVAAINLTTAENNGGSNRLITADASGIGTFGGVNVTTGTAAGNVQANTGAGDILSRVNDMVVAINVGIVVDTASLIANSNTLQSAATGNNGATSVALSGTNGSIEGGVGSAQYNEVDVSGIVSGSSGVSIVAPQATGLAATANSNAVTAAATGNTTNNAVNATFTDVIAGTGFDGADPLLSSNFQTNASSFGALGLVSAQTNIGAVSATNLNAGSFVIVDVGQALVTTGVDTSALTVNGNLASAATTGNSGTNNLNLTASTIDTVGNAASQIAGLVSSQSNLVGAAAASVGQTAPTTVPSIGIAAFQALIATPATVNDNTMQATVVGNTVSNGMAITGVNLSSAAPVGAVMASGTITTIGLAPQIEGEFGLINQQFDVGVSRDALVQDAVVGIRLTGDPTVTAVTDSALSVQRNLVLGDARNNNAANAASLTGFATLQTTAGVMNDQASATPVTSTVNGQVSIVSLVAIDAVTGSNFGVTDNTVRALAAGSIASSSLTVQATNLAGNADLAAAAGSTISGASLAVNADYGIANNQAQDAGAVTAAVTASAHIDVRDTSIGAGNTLTVTGNRIQGVAQATSASNVLTLTATNGTALTTAVANVQLTNNDVSATQAVAGSTGLSFGLLAIDVNTSPVVVSNNSLALTAGHTEAVNRTVVTATNLSGGGAAGATGLATVDATTNTVGTDFSVSNLQSAIGATSAIAAPGMTGANLTGTATNGSLTVSGNTVSAGAKTNSATNELTLNSINVTAPSAAVMNSQTADGAVTAQINDPLVALAAPGVSFGVVAATFTGAALTVSNNTMAANARQNDSTNTFGVVAASVTGSALGLGASSYDPTTGIATSGASFSVLNVQSGSGNITATSNPGTIGTTSTGGAAIPLVITDGSLTVNSNAVTARADVNNASNALNLAAGSSIGATAAIVNVQNAAAFDVTGTVGSADVPTTIGINGSAALTTTSLTVQNNTTAAQASGNTASSALNATAGSSITASASQPTLLVLNYQANLAGITATNTNSGFGVPANVGALAVAGSMAGTTVTVQGNTASAYGYGNSGTNTLGMSVLAGGLNQATALISNNQYNGGVVNSTVTGSSIGFVNGLSGVGGSISGGSVVVNNNTAISQATANSAVNRIVGR